MGILRQLLGRWLPKRASDDTQSELLALARSMHPNAPDSALIAYLLEHAPDDEPLPSSPLDHETINVSATLVKEYESIHKKLEKNLARLSNDSFPNKQKRMILGGSIHQLNRLYRLTEGLAQCSEQTSELPNMRERAKKLEGALSQAAESFGLGLKTKTT